MTRDLLDTISARINEFSKGQKLIANYILTNYDKAAYMTASKLGTEVKVSESTVVRFANELGFDGYPEMQRSLQEVVRTHLTAVQRIEVANDRIGDDVLTRVLTTDAEKIKYTLEHVDREAFKRAVNALVSADHIYIIGMRSSATLASFMNFYLSFIFPNVKLIHSTSGSEIFEQIMRVGKGDVMVAISFPRYSKRIIQAVEYAKNSGVHVIALTDSELSPIAAYADDVLESKSDMASFVDSLVAPLSIINALIAAVGKEKQEEVSAAFEKLEHIWDEYDVYEKNKS